jgi:hypothetical protein
MPLSGQSHMDDKVLLNPDRAMGLHGHRFLNR